RLLEAGLDGRRVVQIGISDFANSAEYAARARDHGITVILRDELARRPMDDVMAQALEVASSAGGAVHVDHHLHVCDRSVATADVADQRTVRLVALCVLEAAAGLRLRA